MGKKRITLVGNGPYANRGCEAIVRGTMNILRGAFGDIEVIAGSFGTRANIEHQRAHEYDSAISHFPLQNGKPIKRFGPWWYRHHILKLLGRSGTLDYGALDRFCDDVDIAMEIGGDNYSLDYGLPYDFMALDRWIQRRKTPLVLWGASVGPFEANPAFKPKMMEHLRRLDLIVVRESESYNYLASNGITDNVRLMADPAFVMEPVQPAMVHPAFEDIGEAIGLSLSPLMARYISDGNLDRWTVQAAEIVSEIIRQTDRLVLLVPHVADPSNVWADDMSFLTDITRLLGDLEKRVVLLPPLRAAEYKWIIGQCKVFVGARTHATIASLSSCVPTISLAYSIKAVGINQDVYGSQDYCVNPQELSPGTVTERLAVVLKDYGRIRAQLEEAIPSIRQRAMSAGDLLRDLIR